MRVQREVIKYESHFVSEEETGGSMTMELPMKPRKNMVTDCDFCLKAIEDSTFIAVITSKTRNYKFHRNCYPKSVFDPKIYQNGNPSCSECGHPYERHYDGYSDCDSDDFYAGCKYCCCEFWVPPEDWKYPRK